uniref:Uncharacterized protein n=1 Tax=Tetradesmus obliquus TaxID=3088 RepID=A0A383VXG5_TETOB
MNTSTVVHLLDAALVFRGLRACREPAAAATLLLQLPAAAAVTASDLARLCGGVVEQCSDGEVCEELLQLLLGTGSLPGPEELVSLLSACLQNRTDKSAAACIQLLCSDPVAQQVDGGAAQQLLLEAAEAQQPAAMHVLLACLLAAPQSSEQVQQLLQATVLAALQCFRNEMGTGDLQDDVESSWMEAVEAVTGVAAAQGVSADVLLLLKQAVEQGALGMVQQLVRVRTLQQPQKEEVGSLLQLAAQQQQRRGLLQALLQLPHAASSLTAEQMGNLLHASVQKDDHRMVTMLCGLQSAQLLQPQQLTRLLAEAVRHARSLTSALLLCKLPAASRMAAIPAAGLIDDTQAALSGIRAALEKDKADSFSSSTRRMMKSMPFSVYRLKRAGNALSPSQVARQTVAAATGAVLAEQKVPLRVWLGMQVVAALQELQAAATHDL